MNKYLAIYKQILADYDVRPDSDVMELFSFLEALETSTNNKPAFTEIGLEILEYLKNGHVKNNKAKDIAEGMSLPSKKVSGAMRKLVSDGYVEKFGSNPVIYSLTQDGMNFDIENYKENLKENKDEA